MSKEFGERLRELRNEQSLTQSQLANKLGYSDVVVSYWESGKRAPTEHAIIAIAKHFNVTTDYLLGLKGIDE